MPELPEVETLARALRPQAVGAFVRSVRVCEHRQWQQALRLEGAHVVAVRRLGKHLLIDGDGDATLDVHLGMSGAVRVGAAAPPMEQPLQRHERVRLLLHGAAGELTVSLVDPRGFGHAHVGVRQADGAVALPSLIALGPDALESWTLARLMQDAGGRRAPIKALLLDQRLVAGIGNYVADEALFAAGVRPERVAGSVSRPALRRLHVAVLDVLRRSIDAGGASLRDYAHVDGGSGAMQRQLCAYGRAGQPCVQCGRTLWRTVVAGRGTTSCLHCQR